MIEKQEKKHDEKKWDSHEEKWQHDPIGRIIFGLIVVWLGISFLLRTMDIVYWDDWWAYFILGLGAIFIIEILIRMLRPEYQRPYMGKLIAAVVLIAIGLGNIYNIENWWPFVIIAVGIIILLGGLRRHREP